MDMNRIRKLAGLTEQLSEGVLDGSVLNNNDYDTLYKTFDQFKNLNGWCNGIGFGDIYSDGNEFDVFIGFKTKSSIPRDLKNGVVYDITLDGIDSLADAKKAITSFMKSHFDTKSIGFDITTPKKVQKQQVMQGYKTVNKFFEQNNIYLHIVTK